MLWVTLRTPPTLSQFQFLYLQNERVWQDPCVWNLLYKPLLFIGDDLEIQFVKLIEWKLLYLEAEPHA